MPGLIRLAGMPFPVEELQGPNLIPVVIVGIFVLIWMCALFKS